MFFHVFCIFLGLAVAMGRVGTVTGNHEFLEVNNTQFVDLYHKPKEETDPEQLFVTVPDILNVALSFKLEV